MLVIEQLGEEVSGLGRDDHSSVILFRHFKEAVEPINVSARMIILRKFYLLAGSI